LVDVTFEPRKRVYWYVMEVKDGERVERQKLKQSAQDQVCGNADALRMIKRERRQLRISLHGQGAGYSRCRHNSELPMNLTFKRNKYRL
jgi:hypothetical protein